MSKEFGDNLKKIRLDRGFSQIEIANDIGIAKSTYSMYESGAREPKYVTLKEIAKKLGVSINDLLPEYSVSYEFKDAPEGLPTNLDATRNFYQSKYKKELIDNFDAVDLSRQIEILNYSEFIRSKYEDNKNK